MKIHGVHNKEQHEPSGFSHVTLWGCSKTSETALTSYVVQQEHKHLQSCIAVGDDPECSLHTLFFVEKQEYLFQASGLPVLGPSDADTVPYAPTDNVLVLHSSERVHIAHIWGICTINIMLDPNQTYSIIHPTMLFQHALICYIKVEKEQFYFVLILSKQDVRREANTGQKEKESSQG